MIATLGHVAFQVTDLGRSVRHACEVLGLRETERRDGTVFLSHGPRQHALEYREGPVTCLDHVALQASTSDALDAVAQRLEAAGVSTTSAPDDPFVERAIRFRMESGHTFDVFLPTTDAMTGYAVQGQPPRVPPGVSPRQVGHVNLNFGDLPAARALFVDVLGFRESDIIVDPDGNDLVYFLRCGAAHHTVGLASGPDGHFHYAFQVDTVQDLVRLGDAVSASDNQLLWGPGRHGPGDNVATYHAEPSGVLIEYFAEMQLIFDDRWQPRTWSIADSRTNNIWGPSVDVGPLFEKSIPVAVTERVTV
jgi:catechol 2,3-dioxygenase